MSCDYFRVAIKKSCVLSEVSIIQLTYELALLNLLIAVILAVRIAVANESNGDAVATLALELLLIALGLQRLPCNINRP